MKDRKEPARRRIGNGGTGRATVETERSKVQIVLVVRLPGNALISPPSSFEWILEGTC